MQLLASAENEGYIAEENIQELFDIIYQGVQDLA